jgi:Ca-activated chloride channel family protein
LLFTYLIGLKRYKNNLKKMFQGNVFNEMIPAKAISNFKYRALFTVLLCFFMGIALTQPIWGFKTISSPVKESEIMFALDTSKSMKANDVLPSRLDSAKSIIRHVAKKIDCDRFGLITFSGEAFLICPLTEDIDTFLNILQNVDIENINKGGTAFVPIIVEAQRSFKLSDTNNKDLVIVTDGQSTEEDMSETISAAKKNNIKIFTIGVGTSGGTYIQVEGDNDDKVLVKLDTDSLKKLSDMTGGSFYEESSLRDNIIQFNKALFGDSIKKEKYKIEKIYNERFQIPLLFAIFLLLFEVFLFRGDYE